MTFSSKRKSVSSKTKPLCQGLSLWESWRADARLRGWTKDAFRVSGITQVLLCTTSPTSSLRSMPPPLVGEALAFRDVFQQTQISFIENETSLPRAPLPGKTPPAGGGGTQVPKGERLSSGSETERFRTISGKSRKRIKFQKLPPTQPVQSYLFIRPASVLHGLADTNL